MKETHDLLNEADIELSKQRKNIIPVLNMVNLAAKDQKYVNTGT